MLDKMSQETLDRIVVKTAEELVDHEVGFLRARRSYLNGDQLSKFESVLIEPEDMVISYKKLQAKATKLGISPVVGVSREKLETLIEEAELAQ